MRNYNQNLIKKLEKKSWTFVQCKKGKEEITLTSLLIKLYYQNTKKLIEFHFEEACRRDGLFFLKTLYLLKYFSIFKEKKFKTLFFTF